MRFASLVIAGLLVGALAAGCGSKEADESTAATTPPAGGAAAPGAAATPGTTGGAAVAGKPAGVMTKNAVGLPPSGAESNVGTKTTGG